MACPKFFAKVPKIDAIFGETNEFLLFTHFQANQIPYPMSKLPKYAHWGMFCLLLLQACSSHQDQSQLLKLLSPGKTGVEFKNILRESDLFNVLEYGYFYNGGGLAAGDLNQDGLPELYFSGNMVANRLYLNKGGLKFEDVTQAAGLEAAGLWNTGVTMADVNGDGWLDIYICRSAAADPDKRRNLLFINNGADSFNQQQVPTFSEQAAAYGIDDPAYSTQAAFFDYDRDGDLDLYLLNHSVQEYAGFSKTLGQFKHRLNPFYGDKLYRNDGNHFTDVTRQAGIISNVLGFGLGVAISDVNQDHWPDIYVSNDYNEQDYLYINQRDGTFRESLAQHINHVSLFSMGSDVADINNDALPDIYTLDMLPEDAYRQKMTSGPDHFEKNQVLKNQGFYHQSMRNMLQLNNGDGTFSEIGQLAGISNTDWSWAALFCDLDNDGLKDLFVSNGYKRDYTNMDFMAFAVDEQLKSQKSGKEVAVQRLLEHMPAIEVPNYVFRNQGQLQFKKMNDSWGMNEVLLSNGAVYADLDRDGDLELITNNINAPASIYQNLSRERHAPHFLQLQLSAAGKNTHAIGAKVYLHTTEGVQFQELMPTRGFQSSVEPILHFGLGNDSLPKALTIIWPDGSQQQVQGLAVDQRHLISQQATDPAPLPKHQPPLFTRLQEGSPTFVHRENLYVDFKREPLLPQMISPQGPKMAKADVNGDGREDVWIGGAKGQSGQLFLQRSSGFAAVPQPAFDADQESEDLGAAFFDADQDGDPDLYVVSGGNEGNAQDPSLQDRLYLNDGRGNFRKAPKALPSMATSGSCVRPADIDRDGDTDLFVGGRLVPGQYPLPPTSYLLINDGSGHFTDQTAQLAPELQQAGMVCDAAWLDVNADGFEELLVVGEWMPVTLFNNHQGQLREPLA
ncbi:MAG: RNA-binding protein, partial [Bacteroidetes bacterium]